MESALLAYRANPTDRNFSAVYEQAKPWLRKTAARTIRDYQRLTLDGDLDDLISEGAVALARSVRRFVWVCPVCAAPFLRRERMFSHAREDHRIRGLTGFVRIEQFVFCSARLAIRKAALRYHSEEVPRDPSTIVNEPTLVEDVLESRFAFEELVSAAKLKLSDRAFELLAKILDGSLPRSVGRGRPGDADLIQVVDEWGLGSLVPEERKRYERAISTAPISSLVGSVREAITSIQ